MIIVFPLGVNLMTLVFPFEVRVLTLVFPLGVRVIIRVFPFGVRIIMLMQHNTFLIDLHWVYLLRDLEYPWLSVMQVMTQVHLMVYVKQGTSYRCLVDQLYFSRKS